MAGAGRRHRLQKHPAAPGHGSPGQRGSWGGRGAVGGHAEGPCCSSRKSSRLHPDSKGRGAPPHCVLTSLLSAAPTVCRKDLESPSYTGLSAPQGQPGPAPSPRAGKRLVCVSVYSAPGSRGGRAGPAENKPGSVGKQANTREPRVPSPWEDSEETPGFPWRGRGCASHSRGHTRASITPSTALSWGWLSARPVG